MQYRELNNLFLRQSCLDSWEDYERSLRKTNFIKWDYIILTASNETQAATYREQISERLEKGFLPASTHYAVIPDPEGERVGSGGATFQVIKYIAECETADLDGSRFENPFEGRRMLVIHSGGDSKRVPQYSAIGKLFSPMPRELPDGRASTLFDELMVSMSGVASRIAEGMLVLSGDVMLLFNPLQIDAQFDGAAAISAKAPAEVGKNHGVYLGGEDGNVKIFLHKQPVERLRAAGAVNEEGNVNLDTGMVLFGTKLLGALYGLISTEGRPDEEKLRRFSNSTARLSFYGDLLYPLATDAKLGDYYKEAAEGEINDELLSCRTDIWNTVSGFDMKLISLSPAEFIHLGTTREILKLVTQDIRDYEYLDWKGRVNSAVKGDHFAAHNAYVGRRAKIGEGSYLENACVIGTSEVGEGTVLSHVRAEDRTLPSHAVIHELGLTGGGYTARIYGVDDDPKRKYGSGIPFLGSTLEEFIEKNDLSFEDLWPGTDREDACLWNAELYPVYEAHADALDAALAVYRMAQGTASREERIKWKASMRMSLCSSFNAADTAAARRWEAELEERILATKFEWALEDGVYVKDALEIFGRRGITQNIYELLMVDAGKADFSLKIRIYYALSRYMKYGGVSFRGQRYDSVESACFGTIQDVICASVEERLPDSSGYRIVKDEVEVALPLRVNWGGGWTDTPPECNETGGAVLNAAIRLRGENPIKVTVRRLERLCVEFESSDMGVHTVIESAAEIQDCHNPYDSFALHKAALIACGIIPSVGNVNLREILERLGGGIYLNTRACGVPKGSGLGTSSILAGACIKGLFEFLGIGGTENELYQTVLGMEQIMSTGGGWQDQVGGLTDGIKLITTTPGIYQDLHVEKLELTEAARTELKERFALIYTGQRRLARNLLRDVIGGYIGGRPESVDALKNMKAVAVLMKFALEAGDIDEFAALLNRHWELSIQLDSGTTNTCIDQIFMVLDDLIDGRFICGAGGGGFIQVIMKKGVTHGMLHDRLRAVFQDSGVDVWDCELVI